MGDSPHRKRMEAVLFHIQDHLDDDLDLEGLAAMTGLSAYHFHRVFKGLVGETLMEHIRRLRLERAAFQLACRRLPVTRAAFDAGYETVESFSRAFKTRFGVAPSRYAETRYGDPANIRQQTMERINASIAQGRIMDVTFKRIETFRIAYARATGQYHEAARNAWGMLMNWPGFGPAMAAGGICLGIGHDDPSVTPPEKLRYDAAVRVSGSPAVYGEIRLGEIPGGEYAVYLHIGPYDALPESYNDLFGKWLPGSGRQLRPQAPFEVYLNNPETTPPAELRTEIWIPLL